MQLRQKTDELSSLGVEVLAIAPDKTDMLVPLQKALSLPFPLLADPEHSVFSQYGMLDDSRPVGGDIVADADGVVRFVHRDTPDSQLRFTDLLVVLTDVSRGGAQ